MSQPKFNFIRELERITEWAETPRLFLHFSALSSLSAVASPNVYLDKIFYKLQPNLYSILLARSGLGKGFPVTLAKNLVKEANCTRVIEGRNSIQYVIKEMGTMKTSPNGGSPMLKDSRAFLCSGEFATFLTYDPNAFTVLTELYDTQWNKEWKNSFKNTGIDVLKNPSLTLLGASSPVHFKDAIPQASLTGGFIGRTLIIREDKRSRINPLTEAGEIEYNTEELVEFLRELKDVSGEFQWTADGKLYFEEWYKNFREEGDKSIEETGTAERLHDHVLKLAMLYQLADNYHELIITRENVEKSVKLCNHITQSSRKNLLGESKTDIAANIDAILSAMFSSPGFQISKAELLRAKWSHFSISDFDLTIETLKQSELVTEFTHKNRPHYKLTAKARQFYLESAESEFKN